MLIIALVLAFWIQRGAVDITSMVTGNPPPSKAYRAAKGDTDEEGPLGRFVKAWWADALEDLDERRRYKVVKKKEGREKARADREREQARREAERKKVLDRIEEESRRAGEERAAREDPKPIPVEEPPAPGEADRTAPDAPIPAGPVPWIPAGEPHIGDPIPVPEGSEPDPEPVIGDSDPDPVIEGPEPDSGPIGPDLVLIAGGSSPVDETEWKSYGEQPKLYAVTDKESGEEMAQATQAPGFDAAGRANVAGVVREINEGAGMTTMYEGKDQQGSSTYTSAGQGSGGGSGSVEGGLSTHINWTQQTAEYQTRAAGHVEIVGAQMLQGDNGPERLARIARIQDMHRALKAEYDALNLDLRSDLKVTEAYQAGGNQAGNKVYVNK
jgi:hypothetical protein